MLGGGWGWRAAADVLHRERSFLSLDNDPADAQPAVTTLNAQLGLSSAGGGWALALEVVAHGVTVNVVAPGYVTTGSQLDFEAAAAAAGPIGRSGTPAEIASCVAFLAHESASFVTGAVLVADGGHGLPEAWPCAGG